MDRRFHPERPLGYGPFDPFPWLGSVASIARDIRSEAKVRRSIRSSSRTHQHGRATLILVDRPFASQRELFVAAVASMPEAFEASALLDWFRARAPWVDPHWVEGRLVASTVNDRGRQHVPEPEDLLILRFDGSYERYDPTRHGRWCRSGMPHGAMLGVRSS
jgi:hypothetical protein